MKKISIILASLLTALLLASCTPVNSFDVSTEEGTAEYVAYMMGTPIVVTAADAAGKVSGTFTAKGKDKLPATITLTVAEGKSLEGGKKVSISVDGVEIYAATTPEAGVAANKTIDLKISEGDYDEKTKIPDVLVITATEGGTETEFTVAIQA